MSLRAGSFFYSPGDRNTPEKRSIKPLAQPTHNPAKQRVYIQLNRSVNNLLKTLRKIILILWWGIVGNCVILKRNIYIGKILCVSLAT